MKISHDQCFLFFLLFINSKGLKYCRLEIKGSSENGHLLFISLFIETPLIITLCTKNNYLTNTKYFMNNLSTAAQRNLNQSKIDPY